MTIAIVATFAISSNISLADSDSPPSIYIPSQQLIIVKAAIFYGAPTQELLVTGHCESGTKELFVNQSAIGQAGEIGAFQYFQASWDDMAKTMGEKLDIHSLDDQARLTAWVFKNHPEWKKRWSTYRYWYIEGHHKCHK